MQKLLCIQCEKHMKRISRASESVRRFRPGVPAFRLTIQPWRHLEPTNAFRHAYDDSRDEQARRDPHAQLIADHADKPLCYGLVGRRLVAFGDGACVEGAFGVDAVGAVLFSGAAACGHHDAAITRRLVWRWGGG
jgi:hypothetical protein